MQIHAAAFFAALALTGAAHAVDMYRWVDETGRIHYGDTVPDQYKRTSIKIEPKAAVITSSQMRELESPTPVQAPPSAAVGKKRPATSAQADASTAR